MWVSDAIPGRKPGDNFAQSLLFFHSVRLESRKGLTLSYESSHQPHS